MSVLFERAELRQNRLGRWLYPDDIEYTINIDGLGTRTFRAQKAKRAFKKEPLVIRLRNAVGLRRKDRRKQVLDDTKGSLRIRCKKSLNHRFGKTKFSSYDFGAEFSMYSKTSIQF